MAGVAKLISNPQTRDGVRTVRVRLGSSGYPATARIHDRPGDWYPYKKGDRVSVRILEGDTGAGVVVTGLYGSDPSPKSGNNRVVSARDEDLELQAPNGTTRVTAKEVVRLGTGEDADQLPVAIAEETARDTTSLQAQLDQALAAISAVDSAIAAALLAEMPKVISGWLPKPYVGAPDKARAPDAKPAVDVVAKPED
jgi:phage baseplate assembly protein gpV